MAKRQLSSFAVFLTICCTYGRILRLSCKEYANFSYVRTAAVLQGSLLETFKNLSPEQCEEKCIEEHFCKSINVENGGERTCELNSDTPSDATDYVTLTNKVGWTFKSTSFSDPTIGEICRDLSPCKAGELCLDTCECPGYECHKCRGLSEGKTCITDALDGRSITALGMEDKRIKNYQLSSSGEFTNPNRLAIHGRLNYPGTWCSLDDNLNQYIRVDFDNRTIITAVAIQGHPDSYYYVTGYWLLYTEDSYVWRTYQENGVNKMFRGSSDNIGVVTQTLKTAIKVFAIKINPRSWNSGICMRMELYGTEDPEQPERPQGCANNVRPLGMASGEIPNSRISQSSKYNSGLAGSKARLNARSQWCANPPIHTEEYVQVHFGKVMLVHAVAVQGRVYHNDFVKTYKIKYRASRSESWRTVMNGNLQRIFQGSIDRPGIAKQKLDPPISAKWIRINPQQYHGPNMCMRMELYGCDIL